MKVLFIARPNLFTHPGGDSTQARMTAQALKEFGVDVDFSMELDVIEYNKYNLIHFFNLIDPEDILGHLNKTRKPFVLSTVFLVQREYDRYQRKDMVGRLSRIFSYHTVEYLKTVMKLILKGEKISSLSYLWLGNKRSMQKILNRVSIILPNSDSEYHRLKEEFGVLPPSRIVTNGVDSDTFVLPNGIQPKEKFVICVARLEGNKNQENLIRAFDKLSYKLFIIGKASPNQQHYADYCKTIAGPNVTFTDYIPLSQLIDFYSRAKVHILPSYFETTGLSSLEAAAMGCNLVVTDKGDVRSYFGNLAWYCNPSDPDSIRKAIIEAMESDVNPELKEKVLNEHTWKMAAQQTFEAYKQVLK